MQSVKVQFQSPEEFLKDYDAYKNNKHYKLLYKNKHKDVILSRYVFDKFLKYEIELVQDDDAFVGIVDLRHKFENVCKVK